MLTVPRPRLQTKEETKVTTEEPASSGKQKVYIGEALLARGPLRHLRLAARACTGRPVQ